MHHVGNVLFLLSIKIVVAKPGVRQLDVFKVAEDRPEQLLLEAM